MQLGFYFDQSRCIGCYTCAVACKDWHDVPAGPANWIRIKTIEKGKFPNPFLAFLVSPCYHCTHPACIEACPVGAITKRREDGIVIVDRDKCLGKDKCDLVAPCRLSCPANIDPESYISLIAEGKFKEALALFREITPFAGVLGRVCTHACEASCERGKYDAPVSICSLKRFMADYELKTGREKVQPSQIYKTEKVAVIGSGPAGLSCAFDLVRKGYAVTVFEEAPEAGGLLRYGIPEYRLPRPVLDDEISYIQERGVEIKTKSSIKKLGDIWAHGFKAIFIATGAWRSHKLGVRGEDANGVIYALDFLKQVNSGQKVKLGERVAVIGGGSVAIDAARSAMRLGAREVHLICLECRDLSCKDSMLAQEREIEEAEQEGVIIHPSLGVSRILAQDGQVTGIETRVCLSVREADGTFSPKYKECASPIIDVDNVIIAIGQGVENSILSGASYYTPKGAVYVDRITLETEIQGVFAGGDVVGGTGDVIKAIAGGKEAAVSIDLYLSGADVRQGRGITPERIEFISKIGLKPIPRNAMPVLAIEKRKSFAEVELGFDEKTAMEEAKRCLSCGKCYQACHYGTPQFGTEVGAKMQKCDLCLERWAEGNKPICVEACPMRARDAGPLDEMEKKYGQEHQAEGFIYSESTQPNVIFKSKKNKKVKDLERKNLVSDYY